MVHFPVVFIPEVVLTVEVGAFTFGVFGLLYVKRHNLAVLKEKGVEEALTMGFCSVHAIGGQGAQEASV